MQRRYALGAVVAVAWFGVAVRGGEKTTDPVIDRDFIVKVATCSHAEIAISKLADKRSNSDQVRRFAATLVKDHQAAYDKLAELIKTRKIGVVSGTEKETKDQIKRLSNLEGAEFDREFLTWATKEHRKAITLFEGQVKKGQEEDIRAYAKETLPTLREHLQKAQELSKAANK